MCTINTAVHHTTCQTALYTFLECCGPAGLSLERSGRMWAVQSPNTDVDENLPTTKPELQSLDASWQRALHGVLRVREEVAVERPAEGEEVQGLAALLLRGGAD